MERKKGSKEGRGEEGQWREGKGEARGRKYRHRTLQVIYA